MTPPDYDNLLTRANRYLNAGGFIPEICSEMYGAIIVLREQVAAKDAEIDNMRRDRDFWKESASQWSAQAEFGKRTP